MYWIDNCFKSEKTKKDIIHSFIRFLKEENAYVWYKHFFYSDRNFVRKNWIKNGFFKDIDLVSFLGKMSCFDFVLLARDYDNPCNWCFWNYIREKWYDLLHTYMCFD